MNLFQSTEEDMRNWGGTNWILIKRAMLFLHAFVSMPFHVDQIVDLLCVLVSNLRVTVDIEQHI